MNSRLTIFIISFLINVFYLTPAVYALNIFNNIIPSQSIFNLALFSLIFFVFYMMIFLLEGERVRMLNNFYNKYKIISKEDELIRNLPRMVIHNYIEQINNLAKFKPTKTTIEAIDFIMTPLFILIVFSIHYQFGIYIFIFCAINIISSYYINSRNNFITNDNEKRLNILQQNHNTIFRTSPIFINKKLMNISIKKYISQFNDFFNQDSSNLIKSMKLVEINKILKLICHSGVYGLGCIYVFLGSFNVGELIAMAILVSRTLMLSDKVPKFIDFFKIRLVLKKIDGIEQSLLLPTKKQKIIFKAAPSSIEFINYQIYTSDNRRIINKLNFSLKKSGIISIVGPSFSGKSLFLKSIAGLARGCFSRGKFLVNNIAIHEYENVYQDDIAYISSSSAFVGLNELNSVLIQNKEDKNRLDNLIKKIGLEPIISNFPNGINTSFMDGNVYLSEAEATLINLVKIFYAQPKIILLDEPTTFFDNDLINKFVTFLKEFKNTCTIFIVTRDNRITSISDSIFSLNADGNIQIISP